jgi:hypothetical protein
MIGMPHQLGRLEVGLGRCGDSVDQHIDIDAGAPDEGLDGVHLSERLLGGGHCLGAGCIDFFDRGETLLRAGGRFLGSAGDLLHAFFQLTDRCRGFFHAAGKL